MFKTFSLRTKAYIFVILSVLVIGIIGKTGYDNWKIKNKLAVEQKSQEQAEQAKKKELEEKQKKEAEEKRKQEEEMQKRIEEKFQKGYEAFQSRKYKEAITLEDEVLKEDSNFYKAYNVKGIALCYSGSVNYKEGMKNIDKSLELKPDYGYARFNKALAYELYGHYEESLIWYDKALEVENFVWSHYGKASIYGRKGDVANTVKNLKIAIEMNSAVKEEAKKEADFDNVRNSKEFIELVK